jgi:hypothetical protein
MASTITDGGRESQGATRVFSLQYLLLKPGPKVLFDRIKADKIKRHATLKRP